MRLLIVLPFLAVGLTGCTNYISGATDPFFGRTRVLPPATGSAGAGDPAYSTRAVAADAPRSVVPVSKSNVPLNVAAPLHSPARIASSSPSAPIAPIQPAAPTNPVTVNSTTYTYTPAGNPYASRDNVGFRPGSTQFYGSTSRPGPGPHMTKTCVTPPSLSDHLHKPRANVASFNSTNSTTSNIGPSNVASSSGGQSSAGQSSAGWRSASQATGVADNRARAAAPRTYGQLGQICVDSGGSSIQPRRINLPNNVIDIMDLPPKQSGTSTGTPTRAPAAVPASRSPYGSHFLPAGASAPVHRDPSVQQASAIGDADNPYPASLSRSNEPVGLASTNLYGHAEDHGWLKGRLEYSQARRLWKLRYIPLDGQTDQFGGSVILRKTSLLSGFERGDYVQVNGRLIENAGSADYAPEYELTQIQRIER